MWVIRLIKWQHSMEEADILGDKIAIMANGRLKAVGKSIHLKNKFGSGYRIAMIVPRVANVPSVKAAIEKACPSATLAEEEFIGTASASKSTDTSDVQSQTARLVYAVANINEAKLIVRYLEQTSHQVDAPIASFGMSQTTLEDVFLRMVKSDDKKKAD
jgi:ABC-type multidrug transport system ATPase subunit